MGFFAIDHIIDAFDYIITVETNPKTQRHGPPKQRDQHKCAFTLSKWQENIVFLKDVELCICAYKSVSNNRKCAYFWDSNQPYDACH